MRLSSPKDNWPSPFIPHNKQALDLYPAPVCVVVAFAGLDVKVSQSGEFSGTQQHISKRGSPYLRRAIWLAANRAALCDPILSVYYQSLKARGKHHSTAIGGVARKLCNIIFVILKENRPYEATPPKKHPRMINESGEAL